MRGIKQWPFVSLSIQPEYLKEWTRLAREKGYSRADLMREALEKVGLPYARGLARKPRRTESSDRDVA